MRKKWNRKNNTSQQSYPAKMQNKIFQVVHFGLSYICKDLNSDNICKKIKKNVEK